MSQAFLDAVKAAHVPDLHKQPGMVCQLWEDGEVTLQKAGELFGQRNLHMIKAGRGKGVSAKEMPVQNSSGHGYAFIADFHEAERISELLGN